MKKRVPFICALIEYIAYGLAVEKVNPAKNLSAGLSRDGVAGSVMGVFLVGKS